MKNYLFWLKKSRNTVGNILLSMIMGIMIYKSKVTDNLESQMRGQLNRNKFNIYDIGLTNPRDIILWLIFIFFLHKNNLAWVKNDEMRVIQKTPIDFPLVSIQCCDIIYLILTILPRCSFYINNLLCQVLRRILLFEIIDCQLLKFLTH